MTVKDLQSYLNDLPEGLEIALVKYSDNGSIYSPNINVVYDPRFPFYKKHKCAVISIGDTWFTEEQMWEKS